MNTEFNEYLDKITGSDEFGEIIDPTQVGPVFNSAVDAFANAYNIEDKTELYNQATKRHDDWKHKYNVTRFIPTGDDFDVYYEKFESPEGKLEDKIKYVDEWINRSVDKAASIRPTERDDFRNHLVMLGNNYIREEAAKEATPGWANDKLKRIIESPIKPIYDIFNWEGSQRFFAENLVENPEMDEDLASKFSAGIGELGSQLTIGAALYASGAGASIPYVFGALYGARYFNEGYRQELDRTGDAERAVFHGITQIPAAALDTFSDSFLLRAGSIGKSFYKEFLSATTEAAKRDVLKKAIPSVLKEGGIQFTSEGIIGGAMADASSGIGSFLATGDQKYLDNALSLKALAESAFVEGTLGGVAGAGMSSFAGDKNIQNLSNQIRTLTLSNKQQQADVLEMLKARDYDGVLKFLEDNKRVENESDYDAAIDLLKEERRINTSEQKTNIEKVAERDVKNFEYVRFLSNKISEIEKINNKEEREFRQKDIDRYNNIIKSIKDGSFAEKSEFESDVDLDAASRYTWKSHNPNKDTDTGVYETLLDNGELAGDNVVYIEPNKFINQKTFNALSMEHGKDPSIIFSPNKDTAKVIISGTNNGSQEFRASTSPKNGWIAISPSLDGGKSKVKILGAVSEYNKVNLKPGDYEITSRDSDSITIKTKDGKSRRLTGNSRNFVLDQQDYLKSKENAKILKKEEETFNEAGALYEQALTKREWSEQEKQDFLSRVDRAVGFLGRLADTETNPEFQDAYLESAIQLLDAKERLSKINADKSSIAALFEPIESDYNEIDEQDTSVAPTTVFPENTQPQQATKKSPHTISLDDTVETAENRGVYYDGKQGKIINDNGDYVFVSNSGTQYILTRNKDITLRDLGVSVSRKNPQKHKVVKPTNGNKKDRPNIAEPFEGDPKEIPPQTEEEQPSTQPKPSIRLPYINHALKLARSVDNKLNGDYLSNNKFTKEEIDTLSKEAGVDISDIQDDYYSIADRINSELGKEQEKADRRKDREFESTGDRLNPNSQRSFRKSINIKESKDRKRKIITELQDKYNYNKVTIIDSVNDLPEELREEGFEDADAIVDKNGRIYFVLENIVPEQGQYLSDKIDRLFAHELVGHLGVSGLLKGISQKAYDSLVKLLKTHNNGNIWNYIENKYKGQEEYILTEEALAFIAERKTDEYVSLFQRIVDIIRVALAKAGLKNWSKRDVDSLIRRALAERKFDKGLGFDPRVTDVTPRSVTRDSRVSYGDIANHTLQGSYGAWIDKSGNMIIVNGDAMSFPHYEAALKELKEVDSNDLQGVYERMYEKGYVSIRKNSGEGYVENGIGKKLTSKQKAVLEGIGINDEIRIVHDNGAAGLSTIYSPPFGESNKDIRYSKSNENVGFTQGSFNESLFDSLTSFSDQKIEDRREISRLKGAKLEQRLIIGEKSAFDALRSINHLYLDANHLDRYKKLLANFVDTRRRVDNPPLTREEVNNIIVELAEIARHQNEQIYAKYKQEFPEIDGENFRDEDGNLDMEKLQDWFKSRIALDESLENPKLVSENHKEYIDAVYKLQEQLLEDINNPDSKVYGLINNAIATETDDPILSHGNTIINERFERVRDYLKDFVNQTVSFDPKDATFKEVRLQYYSLMSILGDGYPLNNGTFISSRIKEIFKNEGNFINPFSSRSQESYITNVQSFGTKLRSLVGDGKTLEFLYGIISPFREGITESQRWTNDVARPYIENALKKAEKINGRHFSNYDRIKMGIYSILRQHGVDEHPGMALRKNIEWIKASISNYRNSYDKTFVRAAEEQSSLLELFTSGIDLDSDYAIIDMEENAKEYLGEGAIQFVDDLVKLFNQLKPLSRLTTEFVYGRKFNEIVNYLPTMQIITKGSHYAEVDFSDLELTSDGDSILRSNIGIRNIINTKGLSSTQDRMRKIGENRAIVLDIVHMADNAGRLNSIDYFTSFERKEIQGMQNGRTKIGKQLAKFLGDEKSDLGRVGVFNNATRTMWHNEIENSSFVAPIQGIINKLVNLWSRSKLSSIHQFFTQAASNYIPFVIRNISNPKKIGYSIDAANLLTRYNLGLLPDNLNKIIERITYEIRHRVQDVVLEKSVSLNVSGKEIKDWIKGTSLYHGVKHLDHVIDKIMFAPFKGSDYISGAPILLAEYLDREIRNNRATSFEDLTYNQESHMIAVDEMERSIGIGNASRRGDWLHNKNGMISVARNLLVAFSSHRINNATNFAIEAKKLMEDRVSGEEKINSLKYMTGIAAQSIVFNGLKATINFMIANLIIKALRSDDDDDLRRLYESTPTSSKEERRLIDAEISLRRKLRKQVNDIRSRTSNKNILAINMGKDMVYNMFIPINAFDGGADMLIHYFYDKHSEELFKENKKNELQRLKKEYKEEAIYGDTPSSISIKQEISDLESQTYIPVSFESRSVAPLGGSYGGVVKGIEDFLSRSTDFLIKGEPVSLADMLSVASILGASQPDLLKAAKEFEKLSEAKLERDEKIQEIEEEEKEPFFVF